jgi:acetoin utilization deacetylase AcuC-like enzyme
VDDDRSTMPGYEADLTRQRRVMKVFATDRYSLPLPPTHTFPLEKYARLRARVEAAGLVPAGDVLVPRAASDAELLRVHTAEYLARVIEGRLTVEEIRALGLPWSPELVERSRRSCGATIEAAGWAVREGVAVNLAGGTHHAFPERGAGYCVFNDAAVAARALQDHGSVRRVVILDADVHQGDGTAKVFEHDLSVFTFSLHGSKNYPLRKQQSDLDIELDDGAGDEPYLGALTRGVTEAIARARADLAIYLAGADPFEGDRLGRLKVSKPALKERDRFVFECCREARLPVAVAMAGGYARSIDDTVDVQFQTVVEAARAARLWLENV